MIEIIDDVLPKDQYNKINKFITESNFLWQWTNGTVDMFAAGTNRDTPQFVRNILTLDGKEKNQIIELYPEFYNISIEAVKKSKRTDIIDIVEFDRIKVNLLTPWPNAPRWHPPHIDTDRENAFSCVYYLHDSDGDTYFFDEDTMRTVTPKKNRAVLFDAYHSHCSSNPIKKNRRIIVNSVFLVEKEKA